MASEEIPKLSEVEKEKIKKKLSSEVDNNKQEEKKVSLNNEQLPVNFATIKVTFKEVNEYLSKRSFGDIFLFILELLLIVVFIILIKLPFNLVIDYSSTIFVNNDMVVRWIEIIINLLYLVFGIWYYFRIIILRFANINSRKSCK